MEPTEALRSIEIALRLAIRDVLGDQWMASQGAPTKYLLVNKKEEEAKRRDGAVPSNDLLDYTETYHLTQIILKNWEQFKPVFDDKKRTETYFGIVNDVRNPTAHSRDLVQFEKDLISGAAGQLRNQVSIYRSRRAQPSSQYYPLIESFTDSFGVPGYREHELTDYKGPIVGPRLEVGQVITFTGRAFNATAAKVQWQVLRQRIRSASPEDGPPLVTGVGDDVEMTYRISEDDVRETFSVVVRIATDRKYHRYPEPYADSYDDWMELPYQAVNPPMH